MAKYKITQEVEKCIGCGACITICDNWILGDDSKAHPKKTEIDESEYEDNKRAAEACPFHIIHIEKIE